MVAMLQFLFPEMPLRLEVLSLEQTVQWLPKIQADVSLNSPMYHNVDDEP